MRIIVCIKEVPDTTNVRIDEERGTLVRAGVPSILNPFDMYALEVALQFGDKFSEVEVIVISMGPEKAERNLREALAMGADAVYLLTDTAFAGADTYATSYTLSRAIEHIGGADLILTGKQAIDGDTAQVGPGIAQWLNIPQIAFTRKILSIGNGKILAERATEDGYEIVETKIPALATIIKSDVDPRLPTLRGMLRAKEVGVKKLSANDISADPTKIGLSGSPTQVKKVFTPPKRHKETQIITGSRNDVAKKTIQFLKDKQFL